MGNEKSRPANGSVARRTPRKDAPDRKPGKGDEVDDEVPGDAEFAIQDQLSMTKTKDGEEKRWTIDDFELLKVLGKGSFGKVMLVRQKETGDILALKTLQKRKLLQRNQIDHTRTERSVLQRVGHPFIVSLKFAFQSTDKLYIVTDFASGGELFFWLKRDKRFSENRARLYAAEILLALKHLHEHDIVYRDLKPENILLDSEGHIKLTDFGLSKEAVTGPGPEGGTRTFCGTPEYLAPEILMNQGHGKAVDWWSLGTLLYEMMAGLPPFYDQNMQTMYEKIMYDELLFPKFFSAEARSLLTGMLERDLNKRLGSGGAKEIMDHPFFAPLDWDAVMAREVHPEFAPPAGAHEADTTCFEAEFTSELPVDSLVDGGAHLTGTQIEKTHFEGFTYAEAAPLG